jgi:predicted oxidoreductase
MSLQLRPLGQSDLHITPVGIGTAPIGSTPAWRISWEPQDEQAAIHAALDHGVNWIDTAPFYGWGRAEQLIGRAFQGKRNQACSSRSVAPCPMAKADGLNVSHRKASAEMSSTAYGGNAQEAVAMVDNLAWQLTEDEQTTIQRAVAHWDDQRLLPGTASASRARKQV